MLGRHPDEYLISTERLVLLVRRHWACLLRVLAETFGIVIGAFLLSRWVSGVGNGLWLLQSLLWYIAVGAVLRLAWKVLEWWHERVVVTDKRFLITSGMIETKLSMMPITRVIDLSFLRTAGGRLLGYGTLRVESAGPVQDLETVKYLLQPEVALTRSEAWAADTGQDGCDDLLAQGLARLWCRPSASGSRSGP